MFCVSIVCTMDTGLGLPRKIPEQPWGGGGMEMSWPSTSSPLLKQLLDVKKQGPLVLCLSPMLWVLLMRSNL